MNNKPERPYISDSDLVLASMDHKEAREFTGGYDKERIKLMREVKQKLRARNEFDALLDAKKKMQIALVSKKVICLKSN